MSVKANISSSSSSSASARQQQHKKRYTKRELYQCLKILGPITNPLPATLPPSPPASRSPSPIPAQSRQTHKRKIDSVDYSAHSSPSSSSIGGNTNKRSRYSPQQVTNPNTGSSSSASTTQAPLTPPGDEPHDPANATNGTSSAATASTTSLSSAPFPVKRPRKGRKPEGGGYGPIHNKYMEYGRLFKRSSDARNNVYARPESSAFCQLLNKPPLGSPYAKHDRIMSKFEALESVLCFAYGQWYKELYSNQHDMLWWQNSASFFDVSKRTFMEAFQNPGPREEALHGIHFLVDAYWRSRYAWHYLRYYVDNKVSGLLIEHQKSPATTKSSPASERGNNNNNGNGQLLPQQNGNITLQPTPPTTGVSPAASNPTPSQALVSGAAHSATSRSPNVVPSGPGTGGSTGDGSSGGSSGRSSSNHHPAGPRMIPFPEDLAKQIQSSTKLHLQAGDSLLFASQRLSLPILQDHFPQTFARVSKSTLKHHEEYEIDFEDDESELFWPMNGPTRGEGLGWVLALGRSMLKEYAGGFGYRGIEGVARPEDIVYPNKK